MSTRFALAALVLLGWSHAARAQVALDPVEISYHAPAGCLSLAEFSTEARRSSARLRFAEAGNAARHFEVTIAHDGLTGRLTVDGGANGKREVHGVDCVEVSRFLAFATALAADPDARLPSGYGSGVAAFPPTPAVARASATSVVPAKQVAVTPSVLLSSRATPSSGLRKSWAMAAFGFAKGADAPGLTWGGGALGGLELPTVTLVPSVRIGGGYDTTRAPAGPGTVKLSNYLLMLEVCSGALGRASLTLLTCLRARGGERIAAGYDLPRTNSETRPFLDLGEAEHIRWRFARHFFAELTGALLFPAIRDTLVLNPPGTKVYTVPWVGGLGELALGFEFGDQNSR